MTGSVEVKAWLTVAPATGVPASPSATTPESSLVVGGSGARGAGDGAVVAEGAAGPPDDEPPQDNTVTTTQTGLRRSHRIPFTSGVWCDARHLRVVGKSLEKSWKISGSDSSIRC